MNLERFYFYDTLILAAKLSSLSYGNLPYLGVGTVVEAGALTLLP